MEVPRGRGPGLLVHCGDLHGGHSTAHRELPKLCVKWINELTTQLAIPLSHQVRHGPKAAEREGAWWWGQGELGEVRPGNPDCWSFWGWAGRGDLQVCPTGRQEEFRTWEGRWSRSMPTQGLVTSRQTGVGLLYPETETNSSGPWSLLFNGYRASVLHDKMSRNRYRWGLISLYSMDSYLCIQCHCVVHLKS